jgi:cytochrome c-type biogenesis protein CcmH/NrfG
MRLTSLLSATIIVCAAVCPQAQAHSTNTLRGAVVDADGTMVDRFTVVVRPFANKPVLVERRHFAAGIFVLPGLDRQKYEIVVSAPKYITTRLEVEFPKNGGSRALKLVILQPLLDGKYFPGNPEGFERRHLDDLAPEIARQSYLRGVAYHREGKLEEALAAYADAMRIAPHYVAPVVGVGVIYLLLNRPDAGLLFLGRANDMAPRDTVIQLNIAMGFMMKSDFRSAVKLLENVARQAPEKTLPNLLLARAYFMQKKYNDAGRMIQQVLQEDSGLLEAYQLLLDIALDKKDYQAARDSLAKIRDILNNQVFSTFADDQMSQLVTVARQ